MQTLLTIWCNNSIKVIKLRFDTLKQLKVSYKYFNYNENYSCDYFVILQLVSDCKIDSGEYYAGYTK